MSDELLPDYQRELEYFRQAAPEFARRHPTLAGRLRMSDEEIDDPHVERLIQAVAFLNARTRRKIDDDFSEISQALLQVLYPHFLAPFPSAAIVRFALLPDQADLVQGVAIPRESRLETEPVDGEPYRFRTCYPTTVFPLDVTKAGMQRLSFPLPATTWRENVRSVIRLELTAFGGKLPFSAFGFERLRFFINAPPLLAYRVYETIFNNTVGLVVSGDDQAGEPQPLGRDCLHLVGFDRHEALVEPPARSFPGYQLLTEYFVFPQKFLFFDLSGLTEAVRQRLGNSRTMNIDICVDREVDALERYVSADTFQLGAARLSTCSRSAPSRSA